MQLRLPTLGLERFKSASQRARVATEVWAEANLYCLNCNSNRLVASPPNTPAIDYLCRRCEAPFQLKSQSRPFGKRIVDAAWSAMVRAIRQDRTPNLFALHYDPNLWTVTNLILIPRFAFSETAIEKRPPLGPNARRAGWVGCNIILENIPWDARLALVFKGQMFSPAELRRRYAYLRPLSKLKPRVRGWTLDVMNAVRLLDKLDFSLADVYACDQHLAKLHPENRHIRPKIRQQLQVLRDLGFLRFLGHGRYRLT